MYNLRARVRAPASGSIRTQGEVRVLAPPRTVASQVTPSQALELLSEASTVPESEVPLVEVGMVDEANEIDQSNLTMKDMMVVSRDTGYALVPATAVYTDDNNTTHVGMLRFGDCDISEDNAKTSAQREKANLTFAIDLYTLLARCLIYPYPLLKYVILFCCLSFGCVLLAKCYFP